MAHDVVKPKLVVFDLDYTLWPFWIDTHVDPPFHKNSGGQIIDSRGKVVEIYRDVPQIFEHLKSLNIPIGVASRTGEIKGAMNLVEMLGWNKYISQKEIYPGKKIPHFESFHKKTGIRFEDMIFFDDEGRNIRDVSQLGVTCIHAKRGMTFNLLLEGLKKFKENQRR